MNPCYALFLGLTLWAQPAIANFASGEVVVHLRDQAGNDIAGSSLEIAGVGTFSNGATAVLPPGSYSVRLVPGLLGAPQSSTVLWRDVSATIVAGQTALDLEWTTTTLTLDLRDQFGATIPQSTIEVVGSAVAPLHIPASVTLPITDAASYPTIAGVASEANSHGYDLQLVPGVLGQTSSAGQLRRLAGGNSWPGVVEVHAATSVLAFEWITATVQVDLRDQFGTTIPGSFVSLPAGTPERSVPFQATLPVTDPTLYPDAAGSHSEAQGYGYNLWLYPGINGDSPTALVRAEGLDAGHVVAVHANQDELAFEWITTHVRMDLIDQFGASLVGSRVVIIGAPSTDDLLVPFQVTLPITDTTVYPTMFGAYAEGVNRGYDILLAPGIEGLPQPTTLTLTRPEGRGGQSITDVQVHAGQDALAFEWITADLTVDVVDQHGVSIPASQTIFNVLGGSRSTPFHVVLPITDPSIYPITAGASSENGQKGYNVVAYPGLGGMPQVITLPGQGDLLRHDGNSSDPTSPTVEVHLGQTTLTIRWTTSECALRVEDEFGSPIVGSTLVLPAPFPSYAPGVAVRLPITDNAVYANITGSFRDGYPISVAPADVAPLSTSLQFEVLASSAFSPSTFPVGYRTYRLACGSNSPPSSDAGPNIAITSAQQGTTVIAGTVHDPDADLLTYRWFEGAQLLFGPSAAGASGAAPLQLGALAPFSGGVHVLVLEAFDGQFSASSTMRLTVANSAPAVSCIGGGVYQAGIEAVHLSAAISDFEGGLVSYSWTTGGTFLAAGSVLTAAGGGTATLPALTLSTGLGRDLGLGAHVIDLTVSDDHGSPSMCSLLVNVVDTVVPTLAPSCDCGILWPPNHQLDLVTIHANATDNSGGAVVLTSSASSSEDPDKAGDGHTIPDIIGPVIDQVAGTITYQLRAERSGKGPGRTYTITIVARDSSGNSSTTTVTCVAPHDRRP